MTTIAINAMIVEAERLSGIGHYSVQLAGWFARIGRERPEPYRVLIICRSNAAHHFAAVEDIELRPVSIGGGRVSRVLAEHVKLPLLLRREKVDAVLNPAFTGPVWGAPTVVTTVHDLYFRVVPDLLPRAQRLFLSIFVPFSCRYSRHVVTTSAATKRDLVQYYPSVADKVVVVPMANRLPAPSALAVDQRDIGASPFVLLVAALTGNKNPDPLVAAIGLARRRHPSLRLMHVGSDPNGRLRDAIMTNNGADWVERLTGIDDAELQRLYAMCLCVAIPSLSEGFGLPLLEAQAFGAPVVASDRGALPEVGGDGALYVDPTDSIAIAAAIERIADEPDYRAELRRAGFSNQARFSWEATAREMLDLLIDAP